MTSRQPAAVLADPIPGALAPASADGLPGDHHIRGWQPGPGLDPDLPDLAYAEPFHHPHQYCERPQDCDPPAPAAAWTWVPTPDQQQTIDFARHALPASVGPSPLQALHAGQELLAGQPYSSLQAAIAGDLTSNWWTRPEPAPHDHALDDGLDGPDLSDDLSL